jgi:hypothetical protein
MKQASLGDDTVSAFDDRQRLSIILVVKHLSGDSTFKDSTGEDPVDKR